MSNSIRRETQGRERVAWANIEYPAGPLLVSLDVYIDATNKVRVRSVSMFALGPEKYSKSSA